MMKKKNGLGEFLSHICIIPRIVLENGSKNWFGQNWRAGRNSGLCLLLTHSRYAQPSSILLGIPASIPDKTPARRLTSLLLIVLSLVVDDVEELELVDTARSRDDAEPVTELHLLEELLGPRATVSNP